MKRRLAKALNADHLDPKARARYEKELAKLDKELKPVIDAIRDSQRITAEDLAITINAKG